jgi:hypothetical protein
MFNRFSLHCITKFRGTAYTKSARVQDRCLALDTDGLMLTLLARITRPVKSLLKTAAAEDLLWTFRTDPPKPPARVRPCQTDRLCQTTIRPSTSLHHIDGVFSLFNTLSSIRQNLYIRLRSPVSCSLSFIESRFVYSRILKQAFWPWQQ